MNYVDEDDDSKMFQPQKATIVQITKNKVNNNDEIPEEKSLGLRTKSILTQVSIKEDKINWKLIEEEIIVMKKEANFFCNILTFRFNAINNNSIKTLM